jgi:Ca2+-binding RTX toxin-like protein
MTRSNASGSLRPLIGRLAVFATMLGLLLIGLPATSARADHTNVAYSVQSDGDDQLYSIDLTTGVATAIGPTGFDDVEGLSFDANGVLYAVDDITDQLLTCSVTTGACQVVGPLGVTFTDLGMTFDRAGNLWMSTEAPTPEIFYRINPTTGQATAVGPQGQDVTGLAASGTTIYGLADTTNELVTIDPATGAASLVGPLGTVTVSDGGIDFKGSTLYGIEDGGDLFTIDLATGAATVVTTTTVDFESLAIPRHEFCRGRQATLVGTSGNDELVGTSGEDVIAGLEGDDVIRGLSGKDVVCAGSGRDVARGGGGRDAILGQEHNDTLAGQGGVDLLKGGGGKDKVRGGAGNDKLRGQPGNDRLSGSSGNDKLNGGPGRDRCSGGSGVDIETSCEL